MIQNVPTNKSCLILINVGTKVTDIGKNYYHLEKVELFPFVLAVALKICQHDKQKLAKKTLSVFD